jgi:hypothetical protein
MLKRILDKFKDTMLTDVFFTYNIFIKEVYSRGYTLHGNQTSLGGSHQAVCPISIFEVAQKIYQHKESLKSVSDFDATVEFLKTK